ncbi:MAG: hypothetical protein R2698_06595 [Microthrixaceae bacterium]
MNIAFDKAGALVSAKADVNARLIGTQAGGKKIDLTGNVHLEGNAAETAVSFSASGVIGDLVVNDAAGSLTLATNKATFVGKLDIAQGPNSVRFNGSIVWDGITAYTPYLSIEGAGEFSGTLDDGTTVGVKGTLSTEIIGGQVRTVVTGDFQLGTLKASGNALVEIDGATTTLELSADLVAAGFAGHIDGAIIITDGRADQVQLDAAVTGAVNLGDITLTNANFGIRSTYGNPLALNFAGAIKIGSSADVSGSVAALFGPNGTLISLEGDVNGSMLLDTWGVANFSGHILVGTDQVALSGTGRITTSNFPLGIDINGTFTSSRNEPSWSLSGSGRFRIGSIEVASARMTLSKAAGLRGTHVGFYLSIVGISTYLEADFYMNSGGGCSKVQLTGGSILARPLATLILPGIVGCPVYN